MSKVECVPLSSAIKIGNNNSTDLDYGYFGCLVYDTGCIRFNTDGCLLYTSKYSSSIHRKTILKNNIIKCLCAFTARKCINQNWINDKDEYMAPNENHSKFKQFQNDSIIYSLFNTSSQQSSLRNIRYHNKNWNIKNEFFWINKEVIKQLSEKYNNEYTYNDIISNGQNERYVCSLLNTKIADSNEPFSTQARVVLGKASLLVSNSFQYRNKFNNEHPEYQINNWDCGWYQIKALCKQYLKEQYEDFRKEYLKLRDELRPLVYELGFLRD